MRRLVVLAARSCAHNSAGRLNLRLVSNGKFCRPGQGPGQTARNLVGVVTGRTQRADRHELAVSREPKTQAAAPEPAEWPVQIRDYLIVARAAQQTAAAANSMRINQAQGGDPKTIGERSNSGTLRRALDSAHRKTKVRYLRSAGEIQRQSRGDPSPIHELGYMVS